MRRPWLCALVVIVGVSCTRAGPPASEGSVSAVQVARVDLIEAGIRAVTSPSRLLYVQIKLCPGAGDGSAGPCTSALTKEEIATLARRLSTSVTTSGSWRAMKRSQPGKRRSINRVATTSSSAHP